MTCHPAAMPFPESATAGSPRSRVVVCAVLLDLLLGDPEWLPHPVRWIGWATSRLELSLRPRHRSTRGEFAAGAILTGIVIGGSALLAKTVLHRRRPASRLRFMFEVSLAASCLALRNLLEEANKAIRLLDRGDLQGARRQLARIVGRDTENLTPSEISRAIIETLAESLCDGVVAPMFYLAMGGVPAALGYKAANTLDSMIGHRDERYLYFGRAAARLDDAANLIPARLTAMLIAAAAAAAPKADPWTALTTWRRDGSKHASPNAGQTEAAMAGALQARLGGTNSYDGEPVFSPSLGAEYPAPTCTDARRALALTAIAAYLSAAIFALSLWAWERK
ncbi:MAG TPA: adenosylcobinamide-phosphate synthase CbiB [Acidobacteriaceae bacterium]|nr:adenosylcobinamide-phosphate synthase CbiB [Acidobacteriaceae bacterium]